MFKSRDLKFCYVKLGGSVFQEKKIQTLVLMYRYPLSILNFQFTTFNHLVSILDSNSSLSILGMACFSIASLKSTVVSSSD